MKKCKECREYIPVFSELCVIIRLLFWIFFGIGLWVFCSWIYYLMVAK